MARVGGVLALDAVFVGTGPGSYTGLRVGIATALGLARATGARLIGIPSFEALAFAQLAPGQEGTVLLDARGGRIYHARYRRTAADLEVLDPPSAVSAADLSRHLLAPGPIFGEEALRRALELEPGTLARLSTGDGPQARGVLALGRAQGTRARAPVEPLYLLEFGRPAPGER